MIAPTSAEMTGMWKMFGPIEPISATPSQLPIRPARMAPRKPYGMRPGTIASATRPTSPATIRVRMTPITLPTSENSPNTAMIARISRMMSKIVTATPLMSFSAGSLASRMPLSHALGAPADRRAIGRFEQLDRARRHLAGRVVLIGPSQDQVDEAVRRTVAGVGAFARGDRQREALAVAAADLEPLALAV